ncbi:hypothetical protein FRC11_005555 [Ceratobasidium sp. 423]|nr:hypothetical protein FRC11_005555 [Ceratobasidium sp. 423]
MGNIYSTYTMVFPPKPLFTVDQIPDLTGQVIIVTGGNAGIGKETCKALLNKNAKVYLAARSKSRADEAIEWLRNETNGKVPIFLELDLANLASIRKSVEEFKRQALMVVPSDGHARVINTSSILAYFAPKGGIVWEALGTGANSVQACKTLGRKALYNQSKLGNVLFSNELAKRYGEQGIISSSLHPGVMPEGENHNGKFLIPWARVGELPQHAHNEKLAEMLWAWLEEQVKGH